MPLVERERFDLVRGALGWRSLDLTEAGGRPVDAVIATRFPTLRDPAPATRSCGSSTSTGRPTTSSGRPTAT